MQKNQPEILGMSPGSTSTGGDVSATGAGASAGGVSPAQQVTQLAPQAVAPQINIYVAGMTDAETFERNVLPPLTQHLRDGGTIFDGDSAQVAIINQ